MSRSPAAPKRLRRKPEDAQREILDAAEALLAQIEFRDLTVEAVMERTAMRRSNFYNYFADRNELVMALVARVADEMFAGTADWLDAAGGDRREAARQGIRTVVRVWGEHAHVLRAMNEASYHDDAARRFFREGIVQDYIDRVARGLRREKQAGLTKISNPDETAEALLLLNVNYLSERLGNDDSTRSVARVLEEIWIATLYGRA